ncbi:MAG TPA: ParB N-terminal domain-containing protein, partial [Actinomycetota bacterium]|nr:ParB N-terminal domain-containing protein [Actinomycetota bacterium]
MRLVQLPPEQLSVDAELSRSNRSKQFEERLQASIEEIGLAEPLKVAPRRKNRYVVIDGVMRLRAIESIRATDPTRFRVVPAYVVDFSRRFELRFQTDIYQDLLPSQLAALVEHLHESEQVKKADIARYIGVSPPTLRNYTGLWRLLRRGGLFKKVVSLMDAGVIPASNPYAWLRLTAEGLRHVLETRFAEGDRAEEWIDCRTTTAVPGGVPQFSIKFVEASTSGLPSEFYREG